MKKQHLFSFLFAYAVALFTTTSAFSQAPTQTTSATNTTTSATNTLFQPPTTRLFPREDYVSVPVNIGFVSPLSIGNIVQASTGKRLLSNVSLHALGSVGNAVEGLELSGLFNVTTDYITGVQGSGIINVVGGDAAWLQGAGIANIVSGRFDGGQGAGLLNIAAKGLSGVQGAGLLNIAGDTKGAQGAGFMNVAGDLVGVQGAGVMNHAGNVDGLQISGILNTAKHVTGAQIGLINIAENNEGVMIGWLNFSAAHGVHLDFWTDEMRFIRLGLRTGNKNFYNLLTAGLQPFNGITLWSLGYGIGTQIYLGQKDYLDFSFHGESVFEGSGIRFWTPRIGIARLRFLYGHELAKNFAVFLGPTFNGATFYNTANGINEVVPSQLLLNSSVSQGQYYLIWVGLSGGFRF